MSKFDNKIIEIFNEIHGSDDIITESKTRDLMFLTKILGEFGSTAFIQIGVSGHIDQIKQKYSLDDSDIKRLSKLAENFFKWRQTIARNMKNIIKDDMFELHKNLINENRKRGGNHSSVTSGEAIEYLIEFDY